MQVSRRPLRLAGAPLREAITLAIAVLVAAASSECPGPDLIRPCRCSMRNFEMQMWCSNSDLSNILVGLKSIGEKVKRPIDELILENNAIPSLPGRTFDQLPIVRLMVRDNGLQRVSSNWLAGLENSLVEVYIVEPELRSLPADSLEMLGKLEAITIFAGKITRIPTLSNLSSLRYLHTQLPLLTELSVGRFQKLPSLEQLHIVSSPLLTRLEFGIFEDLPRLVLVNFTNCGIAWIHPRGLTNLPALTEISFSLNRINDAGAVGRFIRELPSLNVLRLDNNQIDRLSETSFVDITPIREIYLSNNKILEIMRGAFHRLPNLKTLDLSNNRIRRIHPEFFLQPYNSGLEELLLVNNQLDHVLQLRTILDALPHLKLLDLSHNQLRDINYGSIQGHPTLERLHLDHNQLRQVVREAFSAMPALRELRLRNNSLSSYLEMPLWNLPALKGLDVSYNNFRRVDRRVLANLPSLRRLDMSHNSIVTVDPASFLATPALEHVNLSHNILEMISPLTFPNLVNLFELDVGYNKLKTVVPGLPRAVEYLRMPNNQLTVLPKPPAPDLLLPALRLLDVTGNNIHHLPSECFISLPLLKELRVGENAFQTLDQHALDGLGRLETLDLHDNRLLSLQGAVFRDLRRLRELDVHGNRLEVVGPELLKDNSELVKLDVSKNQLSDLLQVSLLNNKKLEDLSAAFNNIVELPQAVTKLSELKKLDLSHNRLHRISGEAMSKLYSLNELRLAKNKIRMIPEGTFREMPNLSMLDLESNEIELIAPNAIRSLPNLTAIKLGRNKLVSIPGGAFADLPSLLSTELQENQLADIAIDAFAAVPSLLMLNLSYNQLHGVERAGLQNLKSIEFLDLSHNKMSRFTSQALPSMDSLVELKLDNNRLCNIQGAPFNKMSHLRWLSVRNNKMTSLSEPTFQPLRANLVNLDIEGNPLRCTCGLVWYQVWLQESNQMGPRCHDGSLLREYRMSKENCQELKEMDNSVPGCEIDAYGLAPPLIGPTQQLHAWLEVKEPTTSQKPLPEDSDYFYDDYVEYEENATSTNMSENQLLLNKYQQQQLPATSRPGSHVAPQPTIPPGVLSHFISGDTPTLYASTKPPSAAVASGSAANGILQPEESKQPNSAQQPATAFTFFGVPIPHINIGAGTNSNGGFWSSGVGRDAFAKGRFPSQPATGAEATNPRGRIQNVPSPRPFPFASSQEGFTPILPGTVGGFRPIHDPTLNRTDIDSVTRGHNDVSYSTGNHSRWELQKKPHSATISKLSGSEIHQSEFNKPLGGLNAVHSGGISNHKQLPISSTNSPLTTIVASSTTTLRNPFIQSSVPTQSTIRKHVETASTSTHEPAISPIDNATPVPTLDRLKFTGTTATPSVSPSWNGEATRPVSMHNDLWSAANSKGGPSSLTGFLAPGGQLPPYKPASAAGRSTITKVTVMPALGPGPAPMAEDLQGPPPRLAKSPPDHYFPPSQTASNSDTSPPPHNSNGTSNEWYFKNYNQTNLEPYVGPGGQVLADDALQSVSISNSNVIITVLLHTLLYCVY